MPPRKKPFSGKAKKQQLKEKREKQRARGAWDDATEPADDAAVAPDAVDTSAPLTAVLPPAPAEGRRDLRTRFYVESKAAVAARKQDATRALRYVRDRGDSQSVYALGVLRAQPPLLLKPRWRRDMTPEELHAADARAYAEWTERVDAVQQQGQDAEINLFERNVEVWRQLWRVLERAAVLVHLADARCPLLHLSDRLLEHIADELPSKRVVIVLTKADLVAASRVQAWVRYLEDRYANIAVLAYSREDVERSNATLMRAIGDASAQIAPEHRERAHREDERDALVVGFVGEPNVGKSSLLNSLFGRTLVSVSATPGHTKHLQTHFFDGVELLGPANEATRYTRVLMCDCPGVVFPRFNVPMSLQILFGSFPIAQVREPFSAIRFAAENCLPPLHEIYKLQHVDDDDDGTWHVLRVQVAAAAGTMTHSLGRGVLPVDWSPYLLCEAYAKQRGFHVKGGKLDVHRAANLMLRDTLNGKKAVLSFPPPLPEVSESQQQIRNA